MEKINILMATYNGSKYVRQQIDSILAQSFQDYHLILSDDGSKDDTSKILDEYAQRYPDRITHHCSGRKFGCAQKHFMYLLTQFHDAPYIMFCDQDDHWHSDKVQKTYEKMKQIEGDPAIPAMVHTDLRVVDGDLNEIDGSFMHYSKLHGEMLTLEHLLVQNVVTGCTMMINRSLAELSVTTPEDVDMRMHDWWIAILAAATGNVGFLNEATMDYRQHGNNVVGAVNKRSLGYLLSRAKLSNIVKAMQRSYRQAESVFEVFGDRIPEEKRRLIAAYGELQKKGYLERRYIFMKFGFYKQGIIHKIAQMLFA